MFNRSHQRKPNSTWLSIWGLKRILLAILLLSSQAMPPLALGQKTESPTAEKRMRVSETESEAEVLAAIRGRLEAAAKKDATAWASFVADDCLTPEEGKRPWKQTESANIRSFPAEIKFPQAN
jgi:hypothetical protein